MISVVLALLAAASNALASAMQRKAARTVPRSKAFRPALIAALIRRPIWLGGIAALLAGFAFQAAALSAGALALVQPVMVIELPFTMVIISWMLGRKLDRTSWVAVGMMTAGLTALLVAAAPGPGHHFPGALAWALGALLTTCLVVALVAMARHTVNAARAALLGIAAGVGFAFTATFIKICTAIFKREPADLLTSWQLYGMVLAGLCSLMLLQNALQSGSLVAAQPALTTSDPLASILYGATMFGEQVRTGAWIPLQLLGVALIVWGSFLLAGSPPMRAETSASRGT